MKGKKKLYIVGTHGVPAKYGGFETLADYLCQNLSSDYNITVYCNAAKYADQPKFYAGAKLKYIRIDASGAQGIVYDFITYIHALFFADVILYLSPVGSGFITPIRYLFPWVKVITNHGGLNEWEREKLSNFQKLWAKFNHRVAAKFSSINIADNELYQQSLKAIFNANSKVIRYGGDHVITSFVNYDALKEKYPFVGKKYAVSVSRAQVDNNLHIALESFSDFQKYPLVLVSNWNISSYGIDLKSKYLNYSNIILLDAIYDKEELDFIRYHSYVYIHTHSRCGTAPSLVEAMNMGLSILSFDVPTNKETTLNDTFYFQDSTSLISLLNTITDEDLRINGEKMKKIAKENYTWKIISNQYRELINSNK